MARQVKRLESVLLKKQTSFGTAEDTLINTDLIEPMKDGVSLSFENNTSEIDLINANPGIVDAVVGPTEVALTLPFAIRGGGAVDTFDPWTKLLDCSGFSQTESTDVYTWALEKQSVDWEDATVWWYSGNQTASSSFIDKISNCMFSPKFIFDFSKDVCYPRVEFSGKGVYAGAPALGTTPTLTPSTVRCSSLKGATVSFFGDTDYVPISLEFDIGNEIVVNVDGTESTGLGVTTLVQNPIRWSAKLYRDSAAAPETAYFAGTLGTITVSFGTAPNVFEIGTNESKAQITEWSRSDDNGVEVVDVSGVVLNNGFYVEADTTAA